MSDTIVAVSTSLTAGAISIIRLSGEDAIKIVNKITQKKILYKKTHTIHHNFIVENQETIDEVMISIMLAPKTFTRENVVEINCHGGISTTKKILELLLSKGCRLAEPGEFTKKAFLNGRIDLIEAEGIMDLISSSNEEMRKISISKVSGSTSNIIKKLRKDMIYLIANINVNIDYPEYDDVLEINNEILKPKLKYIRSQIKNIIEISETGEIITQGIKTAIIGKPNVGKSSLLNSFLGNEKAIVTNIAGTTRDIVEGQMNLDGIILNLIDTAGIRETNDIVEKIGVNKSKELLKNSDLIIYLLNNNETLCIEDIKYIEKINNQPHIIVINKCDLETKINIKEIKSPNIVHISIKENNTNNLYQKIKEIYNLDQIIQVDPSYIMNSRTISILKNCLNKIEKINLNEIEIDLIEMDLKEVWNLLGNITGETYEEEFLDNLFSKFCLGK